MEKTQKRETIFIGVSWPYANGNLSIGHLAGQNVVCDVFARYHRLKGNKVLMVSGTDAHGTPVTIKAKEEGLTPEETADKYFQAQLKTFKKLNCLWDCFTTTESQNHKIVARNLFQVMYDFKFITPKEVEQYYDTKARKYLADRYIEGTCPHCGNVRARGDQCNNGCERMLDPIDLIDPKSKLTGTVPVLKRHTILYFDLTKFQKDIKSYVKTKDNVWRKNVKSVAQKWLNEGLRERPVTRKLGYGVKVPIEAYKDQDIYVWFEAVMGYLSAAIEWAGSKKDPSRWEKFWKNPRAKHYYFIAKDNIPFHTFLWPAMILAYNHKYNKGSFDPALPGETTTDKLQLPFDVPSNQFLNMKGSKLSKSRGIMITADKILDQFDTDVVRYFFTRNAPENHDREFIWKDFIDSNNNELVANLGNFINRSLSFIQSKFEGIVPEGKLETDVKKQIDLAFENTGRHLAKAEFVKSIESIHQLGYFANKYFNDEKPWETVKTKREKAANTLYNAIQIITALRLLLRPFIPASSDKLVDMLNLPEEYDANEELKRTGLVTKFTDTWKFNEIPEGHRLNKPEILFTKLEYTEDLKKIDNPDQEIVFCTNAELPDFKDVDRKIVIGKIIDITPHPNTDDLKIANVDVRQSRTPLSVVCGARNIKPKQVVPVALSGSHVLSEKGKTTKIKKSKIKRVLSEGMLCSSSELGVGDNNTDILVLPAELKKHRGIPLKNIRSQVAS